MPQYAWQRHAAGANSAGFYLEDGDGGSTLSRTRTRTRTDCAPAKAVCNTHDNENCLAERPRPGLVAFGTPGCHGPLHQLLQRRGGWLVQLLEVHGIPGVVVAVAAVAAAAVGGGGVVRGGC